MFFVFHSMTISRQTLRALWGVHPIRDFMKQSVAGSREWGWAATILSVVRNPILERKQRLRVGLSVLSKVILRVLVRLNGQPCAAIGVEVTQ